MELKKKPSFWARLKGAGKLLFSSGYDAVKNNRYRKTRGFQQILPEEEELNFYDRDSLIADLMSMKRNNPIVKSICLRKKTDVVGGGIWPQPNHASKSFNEELSAMWRDWANQCEVTGTMDMVQLQQEIIAAPIITGDIGINLTRDGLLQLVDGTRIGDPQSAGFPSPNTNPDKNGVIVDKRGKPLAYKVGTRVNGQLTDLRKIPAKQFLLFYYRMRPEQWRGVPRLAPCVNILQDVDEYSQIEMLSAKVGASLSAVVKRHNAVQFEIANREGANEQDEVGRLEQFEPGSVYYLEPGEEISTIASNGRPNTNGVDWLKFQLRRVGAAIGIPYEFLLQDIGRSSFSAAQGVVLQYQSSIEDDQRMLINIMDKIWRWRINLWVAEGRLRIPSEIDNVYACRWQPPRFRWINRSSQVDSDLRYLQMGALSLDDIASTFGDSADNIMRQKARNICQAKIIAEEYGIEDWRELMNQMQTQANVNFTDLMESDSNETPYSEETNDITGA